MTQLKVGDKAPDFAIANQNGDIISLKNFKGKNLILYFYPKDNTPGCTAEACDFRDNYAMLQKKGYEVVGVSVDSSKKHQNFIAKYSLPFTLLADIDKKMVIDYGVWGRKKMMGHEYDGIYRTTFVINKKGVITKIITDVDTKNATSQLI